MRVLIIYPTPPIFPAPYLITEVIQGRATGRPNLNTSKEKEPDAAMEDHALPFQGSSLLVEKSFRGVTSRDHFKPPLYSHFLSK